MTFEESIRQWLIADASLQSYLSGRIFPGIPKQGTPGPYLIYRLQDEQGGRFLVRRHDTTRASYMLEVWDSDPDRCAHVATLVVNRLDDVLGIVGGVKIRGTSANQAGADEEQDESGNDAWWYRRRIRFEAIYDRNRGDAPRGRSTASKGVAPALSSGGAYATIGPPPTFESPGGDAGLDS